MFVSKIGSHHRASAPRILPHVIQTRVSPDKKNKRRPGQFCHSRVSSAIASHLHLPAVSDGQGNTFRHQHADTKHYGRAGACFAALLGKAESQEPLVRIWDHVQAGSGPLLALVCYLTLTGLPDSWISPNPAPRLETLDLFPRN
jgi:hypothetical protein